MPTGVYERIKPPWNKGRTTTAETRAKISAALTGRSRPTEVRVKIRAALTGRTLSAEHKAKIGAALTGKTLTAEVRAKISIALKGTVPWNKGQTEVYSAEARAKMSAAHADKTPSDETRARLSAANMGKTHSTKARAKISAASKLHWQDPEYAHKVLSGGAQRPNKPERTLLALVEPNFQYVGDGSFMVNGKSPDFWDGGTRLVELYGDYWHKGQDPQDRVDLFRAEGYDCLVIWEHELKDDAAVRQRVENWIIV